MQKAIVLNDVDYRFLVPNIYLDYGFIGDSVEIPVTRKKGIRFKPEPGWFNA